MARCVGRLAPLSEISGSLDSDGSSFHRGSFTELGNSRRFPSIAVSPASGGPGTSVAASGGGYDPVEKVNVRYKTGVRSVEPTVCLTLWMA